MLGDGEVAQAVARLKPLRDKGEELEVPLAELAEQVAGLPYMRRSLSVGECQ